MQRYFSTFITGFQDVIPELLRAYVSDVRITNVSDGLIVYETSANENVMTEIPFFNNTFILIKEFGSENMKLEHMLEWALSRDEFLSNTREYFRDTSASVRIVTSHANEMVAGYKDYVRVIEEMFTTRLHLTLDRSKPDYELWFNSRAEGGGYIGIRLTYHTDYKKILNKGELRPELSYLLCALSKPDSSDVFLDPFCGSGSIPIQRARFFPYNKIIAGDEDTSLIINKVSTLEKTFQNFEIMKLDASTLDGVENDSVSTIVTDPPWGRALSVGDIESLYRNFLRSAAQKLKKDGRMVFLTAQKDLTDSLIDEMKGVYQVENILDILVSGKKARVYVVRRRVNDFPSKG